MYKKEKSVSTNVHWLDKIAQAKILRYDVQYIRFFFRDIDVGKNGPRDLFIRAMKVLERRL
jgi:hypothetical protein